MKTKKSTPKMSGLVVAALRNLRDAHGSTAKEIMKYIMAEYNASEATVQRQLKTALKRGVEYGILKRTNAGYSLNTDAEVIGPLDLAQMDACGKKRRRMSCPRPKRRCPKKRKRNPCPKPKRRCPKKRKRNPCNVCAVRGRSCGQNVELVRDTSPAIDDGASGGGGGGGGATGGRERTSSNQEAEKRGNSGQEDDDASANGRTSRSRSRSPGRNGKEQGQRSRSQSLGQSRYSGSDNEDDADADL